ncbi:lysophospholipase L1-like esterase [Kribbella orskensis]|uniref:Lysophospholipase L1-like esterase n=1 Tax=Kribbella orskensis TaxID=2512216 RepID=A0ABY2BKF7_9ACTN|nr:MULTISPECIES: SGNH/GDSL hydrolase family protein [Kribbella]TCN38282.1 lysophospholipase L1-like esterase [Kribbella sp. VKM Ac-2500]TCO20188.1 lysophospholipase L1-like esterase [Kribbella orskensis]
MTTSSLRRIGASILVTATAAAGYVAAPDSAGPADLAASGGTHLVTTWGAGDDVAGGTLSDVTVRNILRTSVGGDDLRIRLSNANGDQPLVLDSIYVGRQQSGAAVVPGSSRQLTFGGKTSVRIPPGSMAVSDPLRGKVSPKQSLTVSAHVVGTSGIITAHNRAMQHSYKSASGDHAADESATAYQTESSAWFFLNAAIVRAPEQVQTVATLGDSITSSVGTTIDENRRWPDVLADRYSSLPEHRRLAVSNEGISGNRVLNGVAKAGSAGANALSRLDKDVLTKPGVRTVLLLEGINDIYAGTTADELIDGYRQLIARVHASGRCIVGGTLTPVGGSFVFTEEKEAERQKVNQFIRTSREFDGVVDFDAATRDPAEPARLQAAYNGGDGLHPNDAGNFAMGNAADLDTLRCS